MAARFGIFILGFVLTLVVASDSARAQGESVMNWRATMPRVAPAPASTTYRARRRYDAPRIKPEDLVYGPPMPEEMLAAIAKEADKRTRIALIGDSLAEALAFGMEADPAFKSDFLVRQKTLSASGLVRDDYHDWAKTLGPYLTEHKDAAALIIMLGLNDRQIMRIGTENLEPFSEGWRAAYKTRVDALLTQAIAARLPVIWVGLPVMRLPKLSTELAQINDLIRERVTSAGQTFVEMIDPFADPSGGFSFTGPDIIGDQVRLRGPDGIHFTPAGQRKLAFFVERPLRKIIGERSLPQPEQAPVNPAIATLPDVTALPAQAPPPQMTLQVPASTDFSVSIALPDSLSIPFPRQRPEIGETRALNEIRPAAQLTGRVPQQMADETSRALFDRGLPPEPRAGRADDYSWK